jgi:hypothetical protein
MFTNYGHFLARQERYKDMLREAEEHRMMRAARLLRAARVALERDGARRKP